MPDDPELFQSTLMTVIDSLNSVRGSATLLLADIAKDEEEVKAYSEGRRAIISQLALDVLLCNMTLQAATVTAQSQVKRLTKESGPATEIGGYL